MTENHEVWPPENWSLNMSGKTILVFLVMLMLYLPRWANYIIIGISLILGVAELYTWKLKRDMSRLKVRKMELLAERDRLNSKLFNKFGPYTNEYGAYIDTRSL